MLILPHVGYVGYAVTEIKLNLIAYAERKDLGYPFGSTVAFEVDLPHRKAFCPDIGFVPSPVEMSWDFPKGAPLFAVEARNPKDYGPFADRRIAAKRADYFAAGTQVVWDVDVLRDKEVRVYRAAAPNEPTIYRRGDIAEAEPAVPGWTMAVDDLFD